MSSLSSQHFTHRFVDELPGETSGDPHSRQTPGVCYALAAPTAVAAPRVIAWSEDLAKIFGLSRPGPDDAAVLGGNLVLPSMKTYAACYGGHQFGHWAGQLGDGRALGLGELADLTGRPWEFQLKGAGPTPYSRRADGRAVLRSTIREFICSEAMHALGVPTTRALSVVQTGSLVERDMFYDGNPKLEEGAIVCRVAPSFVRFGNFEILAARDEIENLRKLADYVMATHYPGLRGDGEEKYALWFHEVCRRTAVMVAHWMRVGFVHGVMNTDNMSVLGLTIDYGPYGWIDNYDPSWTPNTTDLPGRRYCFGRQPAIAQWNLACFARALSVLAPSQTAALEAGLELYQDVYGQAFIVSFLQKIGLLLGDEKRDVQLLSDLDDLMQGSQIDMTLFFRELTDDDGSRDGDGLPAFLPRISYSSLKEVPKWKSWFDRRDQALKQDGRSREDRVATMSAANPYYVPRNYLLQQVIEAAEAGDPSGIEKLLGVLRDPYRKQPGADAYAGMRPAWALDKPGCSTLSCSS